MILFISQTVIKAACFLKGDRMNYTYDFNDYNETFFDNCTLQLEDHEAIRVVTLIFYCLTCVLGVPGNAIVVWIAGVKMKRTVNTTWFLNLAIADLLCCLSIPFTVADIL